MYLAETRGRRSPLAELRERPEARAAVDAHPRRWPGYLGLGLLAFVALIYTVIQKNQLSSDVIVFLLPASVVLALVGGALAVPMVSAPLSRLAERLLRPVLGMEASLAIRQLRRHPTRTSLVVGVLMISVVLSTGFGNAILNSVRDSRDWMVRIFVYVDFLVIPTELSGTELVPVAMPDAYADRISEIEGVKRVGKGTILSTRASGYQVTVFCRTCRVGEGSRFSCVKWRQ